jgi:hypothetical protein
MFPVLLIRSTEIGATPWGEITGEVVQEGIDLVHASCSSGPIQTSSSSAKPTCKELLLVGRDVEVKLLCP